MTQYNYIHLYQFAYYDAWCLFLWFGACQCYPYISSKSQGYPSDYIFILNLVAGQN